MIQEPVQGIRVVPDESNGRYFHVVISGPEDSPFEGGRFKLELFLPEEYPMAAPKVRFITKIFHPNVDKLGRICLDILKGSSSICNVWAACCFYSSALFLLLFQVQCICFFFSLFHHPSDKWSPALQIRTVLLSIQALLSVPNPDDPLANDVAQLWKTKEAEALKEGMSHSLCQVSFSLHNLEKISLAQHTGETP